MPTFIEESLEIECENEVLFLHPDKVMYWPAQQTLFVADVHVGKEHRFGRAGIPIPGGMSDDMLTKLFAVSEKASAKRLIVLGDFMHSIPTANESWIATLSDQLDRHPHLSVDIVAGNHDKLAGQHLIDQRITWHAETLYLSPFLLKHEPDENSNQFMLSGHLHPAWRLSQSRRSAIKTPAFWFQEHCAVLPAYGRFTGGVVVDANHSTDKVYMVGPERVVKVPLSL